MSCNKITAPEFTEEQIKECHGCKYASGKKIWCCLFGVPIRPQGRIQISTKKVLGPRKKGCCGKKSITRTGINIAKGYSNLLRKKTWPFVERRIEICSKCDDRLEIKGTLWCRICKCFIPAKVRVKDEYCLKGKW